MAEENPFSPYVPPEIVEENPFSPYVPPESADPNEKGVFQDIGQGLGAGVINIGKGSRNLVLRVWILCSTQTPVVTLPSSSKALKNR